MYRATIKVSQRVHKYVELEAEVYDVLEMEAREYCGSYISSPDDYDDFDTEIISCEEIDEEE